jgi:hypothetical protein
VTVGDTSYWNDFFQQNLIPAVLALVVSTWDKMSKPGPADLEDDISVKLYSALVKSKDRNSHFFRIDYQAVEVDLDIASVTGRKDIVFIPTLQQEEIYLCLEAKRLNALISGIRRSLADEYVKEGMQRFVDGKYSRHVRHGAMLAYVLDGNTARAIKNVDNNIRNRLSELRMDKDSGLTASSIRPNDHRARETCHHRTHDKAFFHIHHLFVV